MSMMPRLFAATVLLLLTTLGASLPALAQSGGRSVAWQRFDVDLTVQTDGSVSVAETQAIQFTGTYQQGFRLVPLDRTTGARDVSAERGACRRDALPAAVRLRTRRLHAGRRGDGRESGRRRRSGAPCGVGEILCREHRGRSAVTREDSYGFCRSREWRVTASDGDSSEVGGRNETLMDFSQKALP